MPLREYVDTLNGVAKFSYFDKLKALGLAATDDPYASGDFQSTMRLWPPVEFGLIFCYFIKRPKITHDSSCSNGSSLKRTTMEVWDLRNSSQCIILKDLVNPSSSPDNG